MREREKERKKERYIYIYIYRERERWKDVCRGRLREIYCMRKSVYMGEVCNIYCIPIAGGGGGLSLFPFTHSILSLSHKFSPLLKNTPSLGHHNLHIHITIITYTTRQYIICDMCIGERGMSECV